MYSASGNCQNPACNASYVPRKLCSQTRPPVEDAYRMGWACHLNGPPIP